MEEIFDELSKVYSIVALVGARQAGKTTLLKKKLVEKPKSGAEVNFIVVVDGNPILVDVKTSYPSLGRNMASFIMTYSPEEAFVVFYRGKKKETKVEGCRVVFTDVFDLVYKVR